MASTAVASGGLRHRPDDSIRFEFLRGYNCRFLVTPQRLANSGLTPVIDLHVHVIMRHNKIIPAIAQ